MKSCIIIPTRLASTRLPRKALEEIGGKSMIHQVMDRAKEANIGPVFVAVADEELYDSVLDAGGVPIMTDPDHPSGSDRIFEAFGKIGSPEQYDVIVNLQGDLPSIDPNSIKRVIDPLLNPAVDIATLANIIKNKKELKSESVVKCIASIAPGDHIGRALYFTRNPAPYGDGPFYHHQGIYAYRREALERFVSMEPGWLEQREKLEQLRALEAGMRIDVVIVDTPAVGVDTKKDLKAVRKLF